MDRNSKSAVIRGFSQTRDEATRKLALRGKKDGESNKNADDIPIVEHMMSIDEALQHHRTTMEGGLNDGQVATLLEEHGPNELNPPKRIHPCLLFLQHLTGFFSLLLWMAAILCMIAWFMDQRAVENLYLAIVLSSVVMATGLFSFYQDYQAASEMEGFRNFLPESSSVIRNGTNMEVNAKGLVPGDIVLLKSGDKIPADIRILEAANFKVDNSSLTGEPLELLRKPENTGKDRENPLEATNIAFSGTLCKSGKCKAIVVLTGNNTVIGDIARMATDTNTAKTPIAEEIEHFIQIVTAVAMFLGVTFLIIGFVKKTEAVANLVFAIGIIVANVPEGLLATVTVSLTLTAKRMASKKVLVKNLEAVETLGSTTVIASDKTGTLTMNKMVVNNLFYNQHIKRAVGSADESYDPKNKTFEFLQKCATLCNNAVFMMGEKEAAKPIAKRNTDGDASESAMIKFCEAITPIMEMRSNNTEIAAVPFDSKNKYQVSIRLCNNDWDDCRYMYMKGAPERIVPRCDYVMIDGEPEPFSDEHKETFDRALRSLMRGGERCLGLCMARMSPDDFPREYVYKCDDVEEYNFPIDKGQGLCFLGIMSLMDNPRPAVPRAVLNCQNAGIKVVMVTGDHPETAEAIAKEVNIIRDKTRRDVAEDEGLTEDEISPWDTRISAVVIPGKMLATLSDEDLQRYLDFDQIVFARTSPKQKLIIVNALQAKKEIKRGFPEGHGKKVRHVVAVTGDGVNDSPALKAANIGVAMGIAGSDVAKDSADMILLNDNFASIVDGVEEGRLIFDNLKKSIAYTLSSNIPEISPFLVFILVRIPLPLPTVLILLIDLGTDMVPAISLAYEQKESNIMKKPPRDMRTDRLVTAKLVSFSYLQVGVVQALAGFYTYFVVLHDYGFPYWILPGFNLAFEKGYDANGTMVNLGVIDTVSMTLAHGDDVRPIRECNIPSNGDPEHPCHNPTEALAHAQAAFFICIIVVQWADIIACKTRLLSLNQQGMRNMTLNFGLFFETALGCLLCYIPQLNKPLYTRNIAFVHWLPALPFAIFILSYDEIRKFLMRNLSAPSEPNWVKTNTYY